MRADEIVLPVSALASVKSNLRRMARYSIPFVLPSASSVDVPSPRGTSTVTAFTGMITRCVPPALTP